MSGEKSQFSDSKNLIEDNSPTVKPCQSKISAEPLQSLDQKSILHSLNSRRSHLLLHSASEPTTPSELDITMNLETIRNNPFEFITEKTSRDTLFKIIYILEEENEGQLRKLQDSRDLFLAQNSWSIEKFGNLSQAKMEQRETMLKQLQARSRQFATEKKLLEVYNQQVQKLSGAIKEKEKLIKKSRAEKEEKEEKFKQLEILLKQSSDRLIQLKEKKTKLMDEISRKKGSEKLVDSGLIDKLLREYYETIQEVLDDSSSVERINNNTKAALGQVGKSKGASMFNAFLQQVQIDRNKTDDI